MWSRFCSSEISESLISFPSVFSCLLSDSLWISVPVLRTERGPWPWPRRPSFELDRHLSLCRLLHEMFIGGDQVFVFSFLLQFFRIFSFPVVAQRRIDFRALIQIPLSLATRTTKDELTRLSRLTRLSQLTSSPDSVNSPAQPTQPTHPTHLTQPAHPTHPTQPAHPTQPTHQLTRLSQLTRLTRLNQLTRLSQLTNSPAHQLTWLSQLTDSPAHSTQSTH